MKYNNQNGRAPIVTLIGIILGIIFAGLIVAFFSFEKPFFKIPDEANVPKFITADFIDLDRVTTISKFRSGAGHDYSDSDEKCRSMKHYFQPGSRIPIDPATYVPQEPFINIYSPVDGVITSIDEEGFKVGKQIHIQPSSNPEYTIRIFHTYPVGIKVGSIVKAGDKIGYIGDHQGTDISIETYSNFTYQNFSYFEVMTDEVFKGYQARGATSRSDFIFSKGYRDVHPFSCNGEQFTHSREEKPEDSVNLN